MSTRIAFALSFLLAGNAALSPALAQQFVISTVAGNTAVGTTPVAGVNASIGTPLAIVADSGGNVYFSSSHADPKPRPKTRSIRGTYPHCRRSTDRLLRGRRSDRRRSPQFPER